MVSVYGLHDEYTNDDIAHRRIYVETSRGCPFLCEYCLSSLEKSVRFFPPERIFPEFGKLIERGVRIFKFLDRSFNINAAHAAAVLRFFHAEFFNAHGSNIPLGVTTNGRRFDVPQRCMTTDVNIHNACRCPTSAGSIANVLLNEEE